MFWVYLFICLFIYLFIIIITMNPILVFLVLFHITVMKQPVAKQIDA